MEKRNISGHSKKPFVFVCLFVTILICALLCALLHTEQSVSAAADYGAGASGYTTDRFDVEAVVLEDGGVEVKETISVDFDIPSHGIFRYIPYRGKYSYTDDNGKNVDKSFSASISGIKVEGSPHESYTENGNMVLRIGDENITVTGKRQYTIYYTMHLPIIGGAGYQNFYFNILPQRWESDIDLCDFSITFPKEFLNDVTFYYGDQTEIEDLSYSVSGTRLSGRMENVKSGRGFTLLTFLPDGYFQISAAQNAARAGMWILIVLPIIIAAILWFLFGRDEKPVQTVEFEPPKGLNSADIGIIIDGHADDKDLISLIFYWAEKGFLRIAETNGAITLYKIKELEEPEHYERTVFDGLFASSDEVSIASLEGKFADKMRRAKSELTAKYNSEENRLYTKKSLTASIIGAILTAVPFLSLVFLGKAGYFWETGFFPLLTGVLFAIAAGWAAAVLPRVLSSKSKLGFFIPTGVLGIAFLAFLLVVAFNETVLQYILFPLPIFFVALVVVIVAISKNHSKGNIVLLLPIIGVFILGAGVLIMSLLENESFVLGAAAASAAAMAIFPFVVLMRKRTKRNNELRGKILGLKDFIEKAEKEKLEMLVEEDPAYFYKVLPYAYVLGISDTWAKKFEGIAIEPPEWYGGGFSRGFTTMVFIRSFHSCASGMRRSLPVTPRQNGGFSGGNGGGFGGFGGGGGFSGGGGFGGGGGGRW